MDHDDNNPHSNPHLLELLQRGRIAIEAGLSIDAEETAEEIFDIIGERGQRNPPPDWELTVLASECESRGDWQGAERAYQKILELAQEDHALYKAHQNLAALYLLVKRDAMAIDHRRLATAAARRSELSILLLMALREESWSRLHCGQVEEAKILVSEAFAVLDQNPDKNYGRSLISSLILRAACEVADHQFSDAQADLDSAQELLQPMAQVKIAAGIQAESSRWWATLGRLRIARHEFAEAVQAWQEAVALSKHVHSLPQCSDVYTASGVAHMLNGLAEAFAMAGRIQEAQDTAAERTSLLQLLGLSDNKDQ